MDECLFQPLLSPVFRMSTPNDGQPDLHWYLKLWPRGTNATKESKDQSAALYLCLLTKAAGPITVRYTLSLQEAGVSSQDVFDFENWWCRKWKCKLDLIKMVQSQQCQSLTFQCVIHSVLDLAPSINVISPIYKPFHFTWSVDDPSDVEAMRTAPNVYFFVSPIFEDPASGLKWYFDISPNGSQTKRRGKATLSYTIASMPDANMEVLVRYRFYLNNAYSEHLVTHSRDNFGFCGLWNKYNTADLKGMKRLCFTAEIEVLCITKRVQSEAVERMDSHQERVMDIEWFLEHNRWRDWSETFEFHGLEWMLHLSKEGTFTLHLQSERCGDSARFVVCVRFGISLPELNTRVIVSGIFDENNKSRHWWTDRIEMKELMALDALTIRLKMELVDIFKR